MRVISGTARGRRLHELQGMDTRPTTDKVKEALFNIIQFDVPGSRVLDLFSGTGQLGIEARSRGAERCVFVDKRREAVSLIRENVRSVGLADQAQIIQGDALDYLKRCREQFGLIFLDPPYQTNLLESALTSILEFDILGNHGIIVCESSQERELPVLPPPYERGREYRYGKIKLAVFRRPGSEPRL